MAAVQPVDETELLAALRKGDEGAFAMLVVSRVGAWGDEAAREFARACAEHARRGPSGRAAEYAADASEAAESATAGSTAALVGYMAAHASEAKAPGSFAADRRRQSLWLAARLRPHRLAK